MFTGLIEDDDKYKDDYDKAIIEMENLLLIEPKFVLAHYIISLSLSGMNKFTEALNHINQIDNNNQNINILTQKGYIFAKLMVYGASLLDPGDVRGGQSGAFQALGIP